MDREANLEDPVGPPAPPPPPPSSKPFPLRSSELLRDVQAVFKRHRSLSLMRSSSSSSSSNNNNNNLMPRRMILHQRKASRATNVGPAEREGLESFEVDECKTKSDKSEAEIDCKRKVQFSTASNSTSRGADGRMATGVGNLSSHMGSLALTEMELDPGCQVETVSVTDNETKYQNAGTVELDSNLRSEGGAASLLGKRTAVLQDELHQLRNFLIQPANQSSVFGTSCATTTLVHSTSAPMLNSTTYCSRLHEKCGSSMAVDSSSTCNTNAHHKLQGDVEQMCLQSSLLPAPCDQMTNAAQALTSTRDATVKDHHLPQEKQVGNPKQNEIPKNDSYDDAKSNKETGDVTDLQSQTDLSKNPSSALKPEIPKTEKQEKVANGKVASGTRKRNYDPDLFFKVNGKLYQRLGKIGSGGSSEVHKVISSDCTIYALKKIKLKGRDYATAFGFCQEIEYLNRLKGKNNIIQLIDYEVTDKALLCEVMSGSISNKDARVKDDGFIYMVLEYGEIDLAHMLSQKWKEIDGSKQTLDENWLRFYWQQILQAVNTIHEERIVHSDLKPANFLLVRGSLKLIDFGIAKAIMSDTTNIQRDSQVGTLSYMSPEAFLCNESDENGNTIKCGRPSDIWSLGCILYQMVYGRTPFSEYKTFWAKFKVITDPNHEVTYEPVSNPWLLDLMKKCLAWDRNSRWRIPQLLQHPFLVPLVPSQPGFSQEEGSELLRLFAEVCADNQEASKLCYELQQLVRNSSSLASQLPESCFQQRKLLLSRLRGCLLK